MDENASAVGPKMLHQRFKSTSALAAAVPGNTGFNGAVKRTAFAEISNLNRRVVQDDSNIGTKSPAVLAEKGAAAQRNEKGSTAALLRPAQRGPYLAPGVPQEKIDALIREEGLNPALAAMAATVTAPLTYRVFNNRRSAVFEPEMLVYKDNENEAPKQAAPADDDAAQRRTSKIAKVPEPAKPAAVNANGHQSRAILALQEAKSEAAKETRADVARDEVVDVKGDSQGHRPSIPPPHLSELNEPSERSGDDDEQHGADEALATQPATTASFEHAVESAYKETENQSGEDDEYHFVEDDGYTTARSFRSRGDNTTGGAPTVVFPPRTMPKDRIELIAAKRLIERSITAEQIEEDVFDPSMVAEYTEEIFEYLAELEVSLADPKV